MPFLKRHFFVYIKSLIQKIENRKRSEIMKKISEKEYQKRVSEREKSPVIKDLVWAFFIGGLICDLGQAITEFSKSYGLDKETAGSLTSISLIFLSGLFTGLGLYEKLAKHAGAGTLVPITGFANAVVSPAIEFKREGFVLGVGANMFKIAGPVIVYGTVASVIYGVVYWVITLF